MSLLWSAFVDKGLRVSYIRSRWYMESNFPTLIAHQIFRLGQTHGHAKISFTLLSKVSLLLFSPFHAGQAKLLADSLFPCYRTSPREYSSSCKVI